MYSVFASQFLSVDGVILSIEPHIANMHSLLINIGLNNKRECRYIPICIPLSFESSIDKFNYDSLVSGSSGSQFGHFQGEDGNSFVPVLTEYKQSDTLDSLLSRLKLIGQHPIIIKIDVDGNEADILKGMHETLSRGDIESLQVESDDSRVDNISKILIFYGYTPVSRHYSMSVKYSYENCQNSNGLFNVIYERSVA